MFDKYWKLALSIFIGAVLIVLGSIAPMPVAAQIITLFLGLFLTIINLVVVSKRLL